MLAGRAAGAMFYSARGAQAFAAKWPETFVDHLTAMSALCLSAAVAEKAKALPWGRIAVAAAPSEEAILALIGAAAAET